jgi:hypothetical protein
MRLEGQRIGAERPRLANGMQLQAEKVREGTRHGLRVEAQDVVDDPTRAVERSYAARDQPGASHNCA